MNNSLIIGVVSFVMVVVVLVVFVYSYFYYLRRDIILLWENVLEKLGLRLDSIPMLIERARKNGFDVSGFEDLIVDRAETWADSGLSRKRISNELFISKRLKELMGLTKGNEVLKKDLYFLSQKKEIQELGKEIENLSESLNHKIRGYNGKVGFVVLRPLTALMKFDKLTVFEFEQ